jgi:hypothetical protein
MSAACAGSASGRWWPPISLRFVADELGPDTYVNLMGQYYPAGRSDKYEEIDRRPHREELERPSRSPTTSGSRGSTRAAAARRSPRPDVAGGLDRDPPLR